MTVPTQPVTVKLADFGGTAIAGVVVRAQLLEVDRTVDGNFVSTEPVSATTDATGTAVLQLFPNAQTPVGLGTVGSSVRVTANIPSSRALNVLAAIPNTPCNLVDVLIAEDPDGQQVYVDQARGYSETAAAAAAAVEYIYPGTFAADPVTRPDGTPVQNGDRYVKNDGFEYVFSAGTWTSPAKTTENFAEAANQAALDAGGYAGQAQGQANASAASATLAQNWATKTDAEVVAGQGFGAKKYANDASTSASAAAASAAAAVQAPGVVGFDTVANLNANLNFADKSVAYVINDSPSANGIYRKSGASGAGSWILQSTFTTNYAGVATPATNPGAQGATSRISYLTNTPGTYTNFGSLVVNSGEIAALRWTGAAWAKDVVFTFQTPNATIGEVVKGAIYPKDNGNANQVVVAVAPGTVIVARNSFKKVVINVTAGDNLVIDRSTTHVGIDTTAVGLLYCSLAGQLAISNGTLNLPAGEWVVVGTLYNTGTATGSGGAGAFFPCIPLLPSNHFFFNRVPTMGCWPKMATNFAGVSIKDLGAAGDGVTDDSQAFLLWHWIVVALRAIQPGAAYFGVTPTFYPLYIPSGTYLTDTLLGHVDDIFIGDGKTVSTIKKKTAATLGSCSVFKSANITFQNWLFTPGGAQPELMSHIKSKFKYDTGLLDSSKTLVGMQCIDNDVRECEWDYAGSTCYIPLWFNGYRNITCERNIFNAAGTGLHSHATRTENPVAGATSGKFADNWVWNGTTGIFFGSNRIRPMENIIVERNRLFNIQEEGIAFDSFGNNTGLCPVIGSGTITAASNDGNGRLVITPALKYNPAGTPNVTLNVSDRTDWTNFYFAFEGGNGANALTSEGLDGSYVKVYAYNGAAGTLTLDSYTLAADVATGGTSLCGVHGGFFNCTVRDNVIEGSVGTAGATLHTYATAISVFLNVFGFRVHGNTIIGCAGGINVAGGQMLTTYRSLAWNNHVFDNNFINCTRLDAALQDQGVFRFESYSETVNQYNNSFHHNKVQGGNRAKLVRQRNFTYEGNDVPSITTFIRKWCAQSLPTPGASWAGRVKELITEDGSGNATDIHYYMCKAVAGVYSWVQVA